MIIRDDVENAKELYEYITKNIHDFKFLFYDNDSDEHASFFIKAEEIPDDFKYTIKEPKKEPEYKVPVGFGKPMDITNFGSDGKPRKNHPEFGNFLY